MITDSLTPVEISADEELELIRQSRERVGLSGITVPTANAQSAKEKLLSAYAKKIRKTVFASGMDKDDVEAELIEAFLEMVESYDLTSRNRLSREINLTFAARIRELRAKTEAFTIPSQQRAKFYHIVYKLADGDWHRALRLVDEDPRITRDTFIAIGEALRVQDIGVEAVRTLDQMVARSMWNSQFPVSNLEIEDLVGWLLNGLTDRERLIIELVYGFVTDQASELRLRYGFSYDDVTSIRAAAQMVGIGKSTAARIHDGAMTKMRGMIHMEES